MRWGCLLLLVCGGCFAAAQVVVGPTVDERGAVGGMLRVRGIAGAGQGGLVGSSEVAGLQARPHAIFGTGLGFAAQVPEGNGAVAITLRGLVAGKPHPDFVGAVGLSAGYLHYLRIRDEDRTARRWQGWALGGELAADYLYSGTPTLMLLSPGLVFQYEYRGYD